MVTGQQAYQRALVRARKHGYALTRESVASIKAAFQDAIHALQRDRPNTPMARARADDLKRELKVMLRDLEAASVAATQRGVVLTARDIVTIHRNVSQRLAEQVAGGGVNVTSGFSRAPARAIAAAGASRPGARNFRTLIHRNVMDAAPDLDRMVNSALTRGVAPARLTRDIARLLAGDEPELADYDLRAPDVSGVKSLFSDARRIAVTETNNTLREANTMALLESPVIAAKWTRSGRESGRECDECEELAEGDFTDYGPGMHLIAEWPVAPHPHCMCVQGGPLIMMDMDEWIARTADE